MDALAYTLLPSTDISSKLPEIAMRKYQLAERTKAKEQKEQADAFTLMQYKSEGFNPDLAGIERGHNEIVRNATEIGVRSGNYQVTKQAYMNDAGIVDMLGKMSTAQAKVYEENIKQYEALKKTGGDRDKEGLQTTSDNLLEYSSLKSVPKSKYDEIRKKRNIPSYVPDEALRPLVRQEIFGEGSLIKFDPKPIKWEDAKEYQTASMENVVTPIGGIKKEEGRDVQYNSETKKVNEKSLDSAMESYWNGEVKSGVAVGKPLKQPFIEEYLSKDSKLAEEYAKDPQTTELKIKAMWKADPQTREKLLGNVTTENKTTKQILGENSGDGEDLTKNISMSYSKETSNGFGGIIAKRDVINYSNKKTGKIPPVVLSSQSVGVYNENTKKWDLQTSSGNEKIINWNIKKHYNNDSGYGEGWYIEGETRKEIPDPNDVNEEKTKVVMSKVAVPITDNVSGIALATGRTEEQILSDLKNYNTMSSVKPQGKQQGKYDKYKRK